MMLPNFLTRFFPKRSTEAGSIEWTPEEIEAAEYFFGDDPVEYHDDEDEKEISWLTLKFDRPARKDEHRNVG